MASKHTVSYELDGKTYEPQTQESVTGTKVSNGTGYVVTGYLPVSVTDHNGKANYDFEQVDVNVVITEQLGMVILRNKIKGETKRFLDEDYTYTISKNMINDSTVKCYIRTTTVTESNWGAGTTIITDTPVDTSGFSGTMQITIKRGQAIVIKGIPLTSTTTWTLSDTSPYMEFYDCAITEKVVRNGTITKHLDGENDQTYTSTIQALEPNIDVTFTNQYLPRYITICQDVDELYYLLATEYCKWEGGATFSYMDLVKPKQTFVYKITEYDRTGAATGNVFYHSVIVDAAQILDPANCYNGKSVYNYEGLGKLKVNIDCTYTIEPDTTWSWKYTLQGATVKEGMNALVDKGTGSVANVPGAKESHGTTVVKFYSLHKTDTDLVPEGDTTVITNRIDLYE